MRALILIVTACLAAAPGLLAEPQSALTPLAEPPSLPPPPPCRTTALATVPQIFTEGPDGGAVLVERFYVAVTCDGERDAGDYQIWWKDRLTSPAAAARLVAIIDRQTETCGTNCYAVGPDFDFFIEVNNWRMRPGCYGIRAIFGDAVDEYWQCTRTVLYTLAPDERANRE